MSGGPDIGRLEYDVLAAAARVHAGQAELAEALARFVAAGGGQGAGVRSIGHWADINLGIPSRMASTMARAADALESLPELRAAFAEGALSLEKVLTVAAVASAESDAKFTAIARAASVAQLSRICREYRRLDAPAEADGAEDRRACRRGVRVRRLDDQFVEILAVLDPDEAAIVLAAIDARVEGAWRAERGSDDQERPMADHTARQADALVELATEGLVGGPDPVVQGERIEVRVNVDADVLSGARDDGVCCIEGIGAVSPQVVRRLACDATVRAMVEVAPGRFELGRAQRMPNRHQRRSLRRRDKGCRYPGCWRQRFVQAHHAVPWEAGGCTDIDNLLLLCHEHHRLFHEGGYRIDVEGAGGFTFRRPDGRMIAPPPLRVGPPGGAPPPGDPRALDAGARFDLDLTLTALAG